jgi:hypothetical protein
MVAGTPLYFRAEVKPTQKLLDLGQSPWFDPITRNRSWNDLSHEPRP